MEKLLLLEIHNVPPSERFARIVIFVMVLKQVTVTVGKYQIVISNIQTVQNGNL